MIDGPHADFGDRAEAICSGTGMGATIQQVLRERDVTSNGTVRHSSRRFLMIAFARA